MKSSTWARSLQQPCVEPTRRLVAGKFGWATHRFAIKGGITPMQAFSNDLTESATRPSTFFERFSQRSPAPQGASA